MLAAAAREYTSMPENIGHVIQISGPAVDVQFAEASMPPIYQALRVASEGFTVPAPDQTWFSKCSSIWAKAAYAASPWRPPKAWCAA